jgi:PKD repeat protein
MKLGLRAALVLCSGVLLARAWSGAPPTLTRGPYLQSTAPTSIRVVCKTSTSSALTLRYGVQRGAWDGTRTTASGTTHVFDLTGLRPETRYAYEIAAGTSVIASGDDHVFHTAPPDASRAPFRFLAWGDSGTGSNSQLDVAAVMEEVLPDPLFALGLGDLVYDSGDWEDYDPKLFRPYAQLFRRMAFWPTMGNHDIDTESGAPYLDAFYLPTNSGAPGHPSGTELYYSFDHGQAHFVCLDSESTDTRPGRAMYQWAAADLDDARARGKRWLIVFMHHPPYTRGTHDSTSESSLISIKEDLVPLFDAKGVDMVLVGHSHVYERSYLVKDDRVLQSDTSEYTKIGSPDGTIYLVSGCAGKSGSGELDHPLMARSYGNVVGFNVIDVGWEELRGRFIERDGRTTDLFTLRKAADTKPPRVALARTTSDTQLEIVFDEPVRDGTGTGGAENRASYAILPPVSVLAAELDSDRSTLALTTSPLTDGQAYVLDVHGVADTAGLIANQSVPFVHGEVTSGGGPLVSVIPRGAAWRWAKGLSAPPWNWTRRVFDHRGMSLGSAGFGFADGDDATVLGDMVDEYLSVYARRWFFVPDPALVSELRLDISYDDGFVAYLNGTEIARANVPAGQTHTTEADDSHEANGFETFDVTAHRGLLVRGANVLAIEGHNTSIGSNDFSLHPELLVGVAAAPLTAAITAPVHTANVPARLGFSAARSAGAAAELVWDFGDGSAPARGAAVEHVFTSPGRHVVTLTLRDAHGRAAMARMPVRIHDQGLPPRAYLAASRTSLAAGTAVAFDAHAAHDPDGGDLTFAWDFGDRASGKLDRSSEIAPVHVFAQPGTYVVQLVVTDDEGSGVVESVEITVE